MSTEKALRIRNEYKCERCAAAQNLVIYPVCHPQLDNRDSVGVNHGHCLNDSMWSQVPTVQGIILLVADNAEPIEGRVNDQQMVILTRFVKKLH